MIQLFLLYLAYTNTVSRQKLSSPAGKRRHFHDETDRGNYRPVSLLSVPSKILESEINDTLVRHVFIENQLATDRQLAYRAKYSTELLLIHLTETWRKAADSGLVVAVAFIDFKKAFDSVSHTVLEMKLQKNFGIRGPNSRFA